MAGGSDVFISYRREERERVQAIAGALQKLRLSVWFDASLEPGASFDEEIAREVSQARSVLVCWSAASIESKWVRSEASIGQSRQVLTPVFLEACQPPPPFNLDHIEDISDWSGQPGHAGWLKVLARIGQLTGRGEALARFAAIEAQPSREAWNWFVQTFKDDPLVQDVGARIYAHEAAALDERLRKELGDLGIPEFNPLVQADRARQDAERRAAAAELARAAAEAKTRERALQPDTTAAPASPPARRLGGLLWRAGAALIFIGAVAGAFGSTQSFLRASRERDALRQSVESLVRTTTGALIGQMEARADARAPAPLAQASLPLAAGEIFRDCAQCPDMVVIPPGAIRLINPVARSEQEVIVQVAAPFAIGRFELSRGEYQACVDERACFAREAPDPATIRYPINIEEIREPEQASAAPDNPAAAVSAPPYSERALAAYLAWLSRKSGHAYRLPTSAEWEYVARDGGAVNLSLARIQETGNVCMREQPDEGGTEIPIADIHGAGPGCLNRPVPTGSFAPNRFGVFDMIGNLAEATLPCDRALSLCPPLGNDQRSEVFTSGQSHGWNPIEAIPRDRRGDGQVSLDPAQIWRNSTNGGYYGYEIGVRVMRPIEPFEINVAPQ